MSALTDRIDSMLTLRLRHAEIARRLGCSYDYVRQRAARSSANAGGITDDTCPKFARHAEHVTAVMQAGGYPACDLIPRPPKRRRA